MNSRPLLLLAVLLFSAPATAAQAGRATAGERPGSELTAFEAELDAARAMLPPRLRARTEGVELIRLESLAVPPRASLAMRLFGRGALAYLETATGKIVLTDAGATLRPRWIDGPPDPADTSAFLRAVMPPTEVLFLDLEDASERDARLWDRFREAVAGWRGAPLDGAFGDPAVLDAFLAEASFRALGGRASRTELLLHELAHAVQLLPETSWSRVRAWSAVTGWRERHDQSVADGVNGAWLTERPEAMVRILLGHARGPSEYAPSEGPTTSPYALFDPREDFAEAVRAMAKDPVALARTSPVRFMAVNATGWVADLDLERPGPLWRGPEAIGEALMAETVARGAAEILERWAEAPDVDLAAFAAVLDAHARWIPAELLPPRAGGDVPLDLPPGLAAAYRRARFHVADGTTRMGPRLALLVQIDRAIVRHAERVAYTEGFRALLSRETTEGLTEAWGKAVALESPRKRAEQMDDVLTAYRGALTDGTRGAMVASQTERLVEEGLPRVATWLEVRHGAGSTDERAEAAGAFTVDGSYDSIELLEALSRVLLEEGGEDAAAEAAAAIPGNHWGAVRRTERWLALGRLAEARRAAVSAALPDLREMLFARVLEAEAAAAR